MKFTELEARALKVRDAYAAAAEKKGEPPWSRQEFVRGFVGDVGDLVKLTMDLDGVREIPDVEAKLAHELADCLWSVLVIANTYNINLEAAFSKTMDELDARLRTER